MAALTRDAGHLACRTAGKEQKSHVFDSRSLPNHNLDTSGNGFSFPQAIAPAAFQGIPPGGEQHAQVGWGEKTFTDQGEAEGWSSG